MNINVVVLERLHFLLVTPDTSEFLNSAYFMNIFGSIKKMSSRHIRKGINFLQSYFLNEAEKFVSQHCYKVSTGLRASGNVFCWCALLLYTCDLYLVSFVLVSTSFHWTMTVAPSKQFTIFSNFFKTHFALNFK